MQPKDRTPPPLYYHQTAQTPQKATQFSPEVTRRVAEYAPQKLCDLSKGINIYELQELVHAVEQANRSEEILDNVCDIVPSPLELALTMKSIDPVERQSVIQCIEENDQLVQITVLFFANAFLEDFIPRLPTAIYEKYLEDLSIHRINDLLPHSTLDQIAQARYSLLDHPDNSQLQLSSERAQEALNTLPEEERQSFLQEVKDHPVFPTSKRKRRCHHRFSDL